MLICYTVPLLHQLRGFFKGMAFPVLTTGLTNAVAFGCYSNALHFLTQSQRSDHSHCEPASAAQVFTAGCFSGLIQVRTHETCTMEQVQRIPKISFCELTLGTLTFTI